MAANTVMLFHIAYSVNKAIIWTLTYMDLVLLRIVGKYVLKVNILIIGKVDVNNASQIASHAKVRKNAWIVSLELTLLVLIISQMT